MTNKAEETILAYLTSQNRPFSVNDIHNNLQKSEGLSKPVVTKAIDQLVSDGRLKEKTYGKQKIFFIDQSSLSDVTEEKLKELDNVIAEFQIRLNEANATLKPLEQRLAQCKRGLTLLEIKEQTAAVREEFEKNQDKLAKLRENMKNLDPVENETVKRQRQELMGEWRKRKRMAMGIVDTILEHHPLSKKQALEEMSVETDEDAGVAIPKE